MAGQGAASAGQEGEEAHFGPQWVLLKFDQPLTAPAVRALGALCRGVHTRLSLWVHLFTQPFGVIVTRPHAVLRCTCVAATPTTTTDTH